MLTRIEIDGFKSFENFSLDLSPFAVILGPNACGKSNLFDAIQFLSHLATSDLRKASKGLRGDADMLFRQRTPGERVDTMRFAVEVLLDPTVRDPWGKEVRLSHTRIRYELEITRLKNGRGIERFVVTEESALPIVKSKDKWRPFGKTCSRTFRGAFLKYSRRSSSSLWLETRKEDGQVSFRIHQDKIAGRTRPGHAAEATVLSSITAADFPHLYALREELHSWRLLQLDPIRLRKPSSLVSDEKLLPDGSNLAAVLYRIQSETRSEDQPKGVISDIAAELATIVPGVHDVYVELNDSAREYRARLKLRDGFEFPTAVISDGTLRILALLTLHYDPLHRGVVCFEEPENGVHPGRLTTLMSRLRDLVTDPTSDDLDPSEPLSQLLMNSHSPVVLSALQNREEPGQILFADLVGVTDPQEKNVRRKTRIRLVASEDQLELFPSPSGKIVPRYEVKQYLNTVDTGE